MNNQLLLGRPIKDNIINDVKAFVTQNDVTLNNIIIQVGENESSNVYVANKLSSGSRANINMEHIKFKDDITTEGLLKFIDKLNNDDKVNGIIVQLPLPDTIDEKVIANAIKPDKDVDGFSNYNLGGIMVGNINAHIPCTPRGIITLLNHYNESVEGKNVVIVGRSNIVGKPLGVLMTNLGATVTICHSKTVNLEEITKRADIVVLATGSLKSFNSSYFTNGQLLIDVGIGFDENGKLCGDLDLEEVDTILTDMRIVPSPGGCGQTTVGALLENICDTVRKTQLYF